MDWFVNNVTSCFNSVYTWAQYIKKNMSALSKNMLSY